MGDNSPTGSRARRKLSRSQVQDILERNLNLYKDEESFVAYMVELAIYLLEYEFDWDQSEAGRPNIDTTRPEEVQPVAGRVVKGAREIFHAVKNDTVSESLATHNCPHCGNEIGDVTICPNCRNLTK